MVVTKIGLRIDFSLVERKVLIGDESDYYLSPSGT